MWRPLRSAIENVVQNHPADVLAGTISQEQLRVAFLLGYAPWQAFVVAISAGCSASSIFSL